MKILFILLALLCSLASPLSVFGEVTTLNDIDISVSPFRYDLSGRPGETITKEITLFNNTSVSRSLTLARENFLSNNVTGQPQFYADNESGSGAYRLSDWIVLGQPNITVGPKATSKVTFSLRIPNNATPGGHYGAITFLNSDLSASGTQIQFEKKIATIILLTVSGALNVDMGINQGGIAITQSGANANSSSSFDPNKVIEARPWYETFFGLEDDRASLNTFGVIFQIPLKNTGNTHIRPKGKITLLDESGEPLKGIARESIIDENGVIISESSVDYIPLNNQGSAVLPGSSRTFTPEWQGYVEEYIDIYGKKQYRYLTPSEKSAGRSFSSKLAPWEKLTTEKVQKKLTAKIEAEYRDEKGELQILNSAQDFIVVYDNAKVSINFVSLALVLLPAFVLLGVLVYMFAMMRRKRKSLKEEIRREIEQEMRVAKINK